jgi:Fe-coproporphyrin III synthase
MSANAISPSTHQPHVVDSAITSLPILILHIHENCNCKCSMCDIWKGPSGSEVSIEKIASYQRSIRNLRVRQIVLTGGEPLLHSQFAELCVLLKQCDVKLTLLSSGLLLKKRAEEVAQFIDEIIISLDGPEAVHNRIRNIPRAYQLIQEGIVELRQRCPAMPILARSTVQRANFQFLRETVASARYLQCNSISFLAVDTASQAFNRELIWPTDRQQAIGLSLKDIELLEAEIELLLTDHSKDFESGFVVQRPEKIRSIARYFRQRLGDLPPRAPRCNAPWVSAVVEADGSVRPCFFQPKIGDTGTLTLEGAINTSAATQFREALDVDNNAICQNCVCSLNYRS